MENKNGFWKRLEHFITGKGFYIALVACVAVIGASAWVLLSSGITGNEAAKQSYTAQEGVYEPAVVTPDSGKAGAGSPSPAPSAPTEAETFSEAEPADADPDEPEAYEAAAYDDGTWEESDPVFIWPVAGETEQPYSVDALIYSMTMADWRTRDAVDIACDLGSRVLAAVDGVVSRVYEDDLLGTTVIIDHGSGLTSVYANLASIPNVAEGEYVDMCDVIGSVGDTAIAEAVEPPHLHFGMKKDGAPVDPADYLPSR